MTQFSTFHVGSCLYGIDVSQVQEVIKPMTMSAIPLAPNHIRGLINLRGQVATAVGLRELFGMPQLNQLETMNVVCRHEGGLLALQVDEIGDVVELLEKEADVVPANVGPRIRKFLSRIYRSSQGLISIINIEELVQVISQKKSA